VHSWPAVKKHERVPPPLSLTLEGIRETRPRLPSPPQPGYERTRYPRGSPLRD